MEDIDDIRDYDFKYVKGHVEVFLNGKFCFSADTMEEARRIFREEGT